MQALNLQLGALVSLTDLGAQVTSQGELAAVNGALPQAGDAQALQAGRRVSQQGRGICWLKTTLASLWHAHAASRLTVEANQVSVCAGTNVASSTLDPGQQVVTATLQAQYHVCSPLS